MRLLVHPLDVLDSVHVAGTLAPTAALLPAGCSSPVGPCRSLRFSRTPSLHGKAPAAPRRRLRLRATTRRQPPNQAPLQGKWPCTTDRGCLKCRSLPPESALRWMRLEPLGMLRGTEGRLQRGVGAVLSPSPKDSLGGSSRRLNLGWLQPFPPPPPHAGSAPAAPQPSSRRRRFPR